MEVMRDEKLCKAHDENDEPCQRLRLPDSLVCKECLKRWRAIVRRNIRGSGRRHSADLHL